MGKNSSFKVDPRLASLLGETYRSIESAIKELVDNSFDADSDNVWITLPDPLHENPIITIIDDGSGMKEQELRTEYLKIASSRYSRKGEMTINKKRTVKGRKGIGKFAGLLISEIMEVKTNAASKETILTIVKNDLIKAKYDLEKVKLEISVKDCPKEQHGTRVTLIGLNQNFSFPNPEKLKSLLILEYGRTHDFSIYVSNDKIGIQDFQGNTKEKDIELKNGKKAKIIYTITDKPIKNSGIVFRVGNKIVGQPENFLNDDEIIPEKLQKRVVGEIVCDDLEEDVTADWGSIVENSKLKEEISEIAKSEISSTLEDVFKTDMHMARMRHKQKIDKELEKLPDHKKKFAEKYLQKVLEKFYGETDDKINTIISVILEAIDKDYYFSVLKNIEQSRDGDIEKLADALSDFGFLEMSLITSQVTNRLKFLDELDLLILNKTTLEKTIHKALDSNLWVLGNQYSLIFSNKTLINAVKDYLDKEFKGARANKRPDLFLAEDISRNYLLIEFKKPSASIGRDAESQALKYRDDLNTVIHSKKILIYIVGGRIDQSISSQNEREDVKFLTYTDIISNARNQLSWLLNELNTDN